MDTLYSTFSQKNRENPACFFNMYADSYKISQYLGKKKNADPSSPEGIRILCGFLQKAGRRMAVKNAFRQFQNFVLFLPAHIFITFSFLFIFFYFPVSIFPCFNFSLLQFYRFIYFFRSRDFPVISTGCSLPMTWIRVGTISARTPPSASV